MKPSQLLRVSLLSLSGACLIVSFQNCSKVGVSDSTPGAVTLASSSGGSDSPAPASSDGSSSSSSSVSDGTDSPACDAANMHKQYLLDSLVVNGMSVDLSSLQQHLQIQFIHIDASTVCEAMSIKVQGEGLCTAFHGSLIEEIDPKTKVIRDLISVQPASDNSSACKAGTLEQQVYDQVLNALNNSDSIVFQADGYLIVKSGNVVVSFFTKHSQI